MPRNYYFGISAASAETPDSFEVNKFVVSTTNSYTREEVRRQPAPDRGTTLPIEQAQELGQKPQQYQPGRTGEVPAVTDAQYYEMLSRLQKTIQSLDSIYSELLNLDQRLVERHNELKGQGVPYEQLNAMDRRIQGIELTVQRIQRDVEGRDYKESLTGLQAALKDTQENLLNTLPQSMSQSKFTSLFSIKMRRKSVAYTLLQLSQGQRRKWASSSLSSWLSRRSWRVPMFSTSGGEPIRPRSSCKCGAQCPHAALYCEAGDDFIYIIGGFCTVCCHTIEQ